MLARHILTIRRCISLLNSIVESGEQHSPASRRVVTDALNLLDAVGDADESRHENQDPIPDPPLEPGHPARNAGVGGHPSPSPFNPPITRRLFPKTPEGKPILPPLDSWIPPHPKDRDQSPQ